MLSGAGRGTRGTRTTLRETSWRASSDLTTTMLGRRSGHGAVTSGRTPCIVGKRKAPRVAGLVGPNVRRKGGGRRTLVGVDHVAHQRDNSITVDEKSPGESGAEVRFDRRAFSSWVAAGSGNISGYCRHRLRRLFRGRLGNKWADRSCPARLSRERPRRARRSGDSGIGQDSVRQYVLDSATLHEPLRRKKAPR
jgi:hypothetical protein